MAGDMLSADGVSLVARQIDVLKAIQALYPLYGFMRTNGFSREDIRQIIQGQGRGSLMGDASLAGTYRFDLPLSGAIPTGGGALLDEKSLFIGCLKPLRNNLTDITDPSYTGNNISLDTISIYFSPDGSNSFQRGDSTAAGSLMGPFDAPFVPFSWDTPVGDRPYPAPIVHDPVRLDIVLPQAAGSGVMVWSKEACCRPPTEQGKHPYCSLQPGSPSRGPGFSRAGPPGLV